MFTACRQYSIQGRIKLGIFAKATNERKKKKRFNFFSQQELKDKQNFILIHKKKRFLDCAKQDENLQDKSRDHRQM